MPHHVNAFRIARIMSNIVRYPSQSFGYVPCLSRVLNSRRETIVDRDIHEVVTHEYSRLARANVRIRLVANLPRSTVNHHNNWLQVAAGSRPCLGGIDIEAKLIWIHPGDMVVGNIAVNGEVIIGCSGRKSWAQSQCCEQDKRPHQNS